jgi:hypothetical protein
MKIYLAGPMRGHADLNHPEFHHWTGVLREGGHEVFNPAEWPGGDIRWSLGLDLAWITSRADAVVLLPGWQGSLGAKAEAATAEAIGIPAMLIDDFLAEHVYHTDVWEGAS